MNVLTKAIADIAPAVDDAESATGKFDVILSAETLDRDGDELKKGEWKLPLPDHITFDTDHGMSVATTVGSGAPFIHEDGTLRVSGTYSSIPRAQEVRTLVNEGHIRTTSVAFMTEKASKAAGGTVQRELLNGAFVAVPSNREAVILSSKAGARNSQTDASHMQAAHDHLVAMGASCGKSVSAPPAVVEKSIVGSVEALQDRCRDALEDAYSGAYTYLRGTLPDRVVYSASSPLTGEYAIYSQAYTDDGAVVTLTGTPTEVDVQEIVVPDADDDLTDKAASDELAVRAAQFRAYVTAL